MDVYQDKGLLKIAAEMKEAEVKKSKTGASQKVMSGD